MANPSLKREAALITARFNRPVVKAAVAEAREREKRTTAQRVPSEKIPPEPAPPVEFLSTTYNVLVISVDEERVGVLRQQLDPFGYKVEHVNTAVLGLERLLTRPPDLVLCDANMDHMSGYELCRVVKRRRRSEHIPFVLMGKAPDMDEKTRGYHVGADDFIGFPVHEVELRARVRSFVRLKMYLQRMHNEVRALDFKLRGRTRELEEITLGLVAALEKANELNDTDTGKHIQRVCRYSGLFAERFDLGQGAVQRIARYASLHDVGKVAVADKVLKKRGPLTHEEMEEMKRHTVHGYKLLKEARADDVACNIALCHHERWDGAGYPQGLMGEVIPVEARIVALADVYDALTTRRCYKEAMPVAEALTYVREQAGRHFDPRLVQVFFQSFREVCEIQQELADDEEAALL